MFKTIFLFIVCIASFIYSSQGQDFEIMTNPLDKTTAGTTPFVTGDESHDFVAMTTQVDNISNDPITIVWRNLSTDTTQNPDHWVLVGVCDNILCRSEYGAWYYGEADTAAPIQPGANMPLIIHVYAPTGTPDAVGTYKIELKTPDQTDTAVFILTKDASTGISVISLKDKRVSIYPNPASGRDLHVYIDPNLHASKATIYSIAGQEQMHLPVVENKDLTTFNVSHLPTGAYILRLTDVNGRTITSRKFSRK